MAATFRRNSIFLRNLLTRIVLTLLAAVVIVWFLPRAETVHYRYDVGKPWTGGTLIAKFQFPIYKSDEVIAAERDSVRDSFQPYYVVDSEIEESALASLAKDIDTDFPEQARSYKNIILQELHRYYEQGIMPPNAQGLSSTDSATIVRVVRGRSAVPTPLGELYTIKSAYQQLLSNPLIVASRQVVQRMNLDRYIHANLRYDEQRSESEMQELLNSVAESDGMVMAGQKIVDKGDIVDERTARILLSLEKESLRQSTDSKETLYRMGGQAVIVLLLLSLLTTYIALFRRDYFDKPRSLLMVYVLTVFFPVVVSLMMRHAFLNIYLLPFALAPMFIRVFLDSRTAFMVHLVLVLLCAVAVKYQYEFIVVQLVAGLVAIYSLREVSKRSQVFVASLLVTLVSIAVYYVLQVVQIGDSINTDRSMYVFFIGNGVLLLLAYPLMYIIEKLFGFTSDVTLVELSDTNRDLLRQLSEVAPGTFQHSVMVGNLASDIANRIGAKSLLVRTGALYHDIGKMANPYYYTENQAGANPHAGIDERESARIIISHVSEGIRMAEKKHLPAVIKDFIRTHHGSGITKYFYINYKNAHPEEEVDPAAFTYPGPNPSTKEQAILMMADTVEAASRSLSEYSEESITQLVDRLIDGQVQEGYFTDCPITFHDIRVAKLALVERLKAIYHARIAYPKDTTEN
ncbi:MAG: HDIG domain-containing protein [Bacteroidaceae bacterium]|nr:HDIG domain-containing protein [Bacteroidaceae bacterium]